MNVLFVNMPFNAIRPAIGISLLKGHLERMGIPSRIVYLNMRFAKLVGLTDYKYIAEHSPPESLAGDWIFSGCAFDRSDDTDAAYLQTFTQRFVKYPMSEIGAALKNCRAKAEEFIQECLEQIDWQAYNVIGFTSTFTQHGASLALARRVKQRFPHLLIAFGGANCESEMGLQLHRSFPFIDFVCSGEADVTFPRMIQTLMDGGDVHQIPGLISRLDGCSHCVNLMPEQVKDMDSLPYPNYDDYFEQYAEVGLSSKDQVGILMESSRGCWWGQKHHCTFCGLNGMSMAFRSKSATRVMQEINDLSGKYKAQYVEMVDNILDMQYFDTLILDLKKRQLKLGLFYETKANLTKEQLRALSEAGIETIQPGIESFSTDILRIMRKGTSAIQNIQLLKWCKEFGIKAFWNVLYGFPGENPADYESVAKIISSIHHLQPPEGFGPIRLDRFSPNFFSADQLGICNVRPDRSYQYIYDLPEPQLFNLAYYFEHDYSDGRDPEDYVGEAYMAVKHWHEDSGTRGLVYANHDDTLAIWDFRSGAEKKLTILSGHESALYLYCDRNRSFQQIERFLSERGASDTPVEALLERLVGSRLMINLDERYLSLAVPATSVASGNKHSGTGSAVPNHVLL